MPDPTTQSNYLQIVTEQASFNWVVDFQQKIISGSVKHDLRVKEDGVKEIMSVVKLERNSAAHNIEMVASILGI
jgi:hypothetical protein